MTIQNGLETEDLRILDILKNKRSIILLNKIDEKNEGLENDINIKQTNKPVIKISAKTQGDKVVIKIKDEGIGIAKKYHKKIFDKFFQVENSMSKTEASTGLGLAISKELVKMHGGEISVDSSKGNGTEFTIILKSDYQG